MNDFNQMANILSNFSYQKRKILTVNGLKEAQEIKLNSGESVLFLDSNDDILYLKQCDDIGKTSLRVYRCNDITDEIIQGNEEMTICKKDLDTFKNELLNEVKAMIGGPSELNVREQQN